jgi:hypothetical protein
MSKLREMVKRIIKEETSINSKQLQVGDIITMKFDDEDDPKIKAGEYEVTGNAKGGKYLRRISGGKELFFSDGQISQDFEK